MAHQVPSFVPKVFDLIFEVFQGKTSADRTAKNGTLSDIYQINKFGLILVRLGNPFPAEPELYKRWVATCIKVSPQAYLEDEEERLHLDKPGWVLGSFMGKEVRKDPSKETQRIRDIETMLGAMDMWDFTGRALRIGRIFNAHLPAKDVGQVLYFWDAEPHTRYLTIRNFWEGFYTPPPNPSKPKPSKTTGTPQTVVENTQIES